jgi:predicted RNA methylase
MTRVSWPLLVVFVLVPASYSLAAAPAPTKTPDVVYVPTPNDVVAKMLDIAQVKADDVVYDLGCGDGRIVVTAAKKFGCQAVGFDIDPQRVREARANIEKNGVGKLVSIKQEDIFKLDLSPASVVTLYLLPSLNVKLIPQLEKLKHGSRIITHDFDIDGVKPEKVISFVSEEDNVSHTIYYFTTPLKKQK